MSNWSLSVLLSSLHEDIQKRLEISRKALGHPVDKGDASEKIWLELLQKYLPNRYQAASACVVDSNGKFSDQIDVVVFDRQYSPFILSYENSLIIPAESVYAVFEVKQKISAEYIKYASKKIESVRGLHRTSLPIPYAKGTYPAKELIPILGGILTFESNWIPALGKPLINALEKIDENNRLNLGCVAAHGCFSYNSTNTSYEICNGKKPATTFLFNLISSLQFSGTVPMIDIQAYAKWLND